MRRARTTDEYIQIEIVQNYGDRISFADLLHRLNATHQLGLDVGDD